MKTIKLGSLFDGIGGWPLAGIRHGITPVWSSEIEQFPIEVTQRHFPDMKHLGDITKINGAGIEPVHVITFGSPCQDLSVAGKRAGMAGERSGLFIEAVRIIREMRDATDGEYPRFAVWENVPGAFSSNKGDDFRAVLEEICEAQIPMPESGKWATSGMVGGNGVEVAWRVLDAQYWGVPQRRKRIFLVADFRGCCAGEVLFKPESMPGDTQESRSQREGITGSFETGVKGTEYLTSWDNQEKRIFTDKGVSPTISGSDGGGGRTGVGYVLTTGSIEGGIEAASVLPFDTTQITSPQNGNKPKYGDPCHPLCATAHIPAIVQKSIGFSGNQDGGDNITEKCPTLRADPGSGNGCKMAVCYGADLSQKAEGIGLASEKSACLTAGTHPGHGCHVVYPQITGTLLANAAGTARPGGNKNETDMVVAIQHSIIGRKPEAGAQGAGYRDDGKMFTLDSRGAAHCIAYGNEENNEVANTLLAKSNLSYRRDMDNLAVSAVDCRNLNEGEISGTLQSKSGGGYSLNYQNHVRIGYAVRRLTPTECERLQGLPDNYTAGGSDTARYKAIGNGMAQPCADYVISGIVEVLKNKLIKG